MKSVGVVIVAGGSGKRMQSELPKQFLSLHGKPILQHTIDRFLSWKSDLEVVLVLPKDQHEYWKTIGDSNQYYTIVEGGKERFHSVAAGLDHIHSDLCMIHDGVRPFVSHTTLNRCLEKAKSLGSAVPVLEAYESIRKITGNTSEAIPRNAIRFVQTPQVFRTDWLRVAFKQPYQVYFTDDATVVQKAGFPIHMVHGNRSNVKITTPEDLQMAACLIQNSFHE
jgi:2-C-methyl-D-erythritol 4-phosphate cytidylyltransferase